MVVREKDCLTFRSRLEVGADDDGDYCEEHEAVACPSQAEEVAVFHFHETLFHERLAAEHFNVRRCNEVVPGRNRHPVIVGDIVAKPICPGFLIASSISRMLEKNASPGWWQLSSSS